MARTQSRVTTDHEEIRRWAEERGARPACVRGTGNNDDVGILRLDFPGYSGQQSLQHIDWDEFFEKFDERGLALLYQETTAGGEKSNFNKLISRESTQQRRGRSSQQGGTRAARAQSGARRSKSRRQASGGTGRSRSSRRSSSRTSARSNRSESGSRATGKSSRRSSIRS